MNTRNRIKLIKEEIDKIGKDGDIKDLKEINNYIDCVIQYYNSKNRNH